VKELVFHRMFFPAIERFSSKVGFHDGVYHATFDQHADRVLRLGDSMRRELGLSRDDRFGIMACNGHEFLELYHAGFLGAGIVNPLNLRLAGSELQLILADSGTEVVFVDSVFADHFLRSIAGVRADLPLRHVVLIGDGDAPCDYRYEDLIKQGEATIPPEPEEDDPVMLMYTGGTTGLPKGALLEQRAEILNLYHIGLAVGFREDRVYLHQTPMFHAASMAGALGIPTTGGVSTFVPLFEPGQVLSTIEEYGVDWTVMVPTMLAMALDDPSFEPSRLASLLDLVYGASPMPGSLLRRIQIELPDVNLWQGYGMTECSSVLTVLSAADHAKGGDVLRSAGRPVVGVEVTIQDEHGNVVPAGQEGEVCAKGGNFLREYWHRPEQTEHAFRGGWYHTGDLGHIDGEGYVHLVDRLNDMIVSGGENVYSIEVENALSTHPAVSQVAVIGIPHPVWGEQVHAIVVLRPDASATEEELIAHARQTIAGYKVPKSIEFRTEALPVSGALKPMKRELRAPYWEGQER
jgi:acyl-CoA synthetase (AMP-forming)/AMP-acid ligase II